MTEAPDKSPPTNRGESPKMQAYYAALGEFIDHFSWAETALIGLVLILARVTPPAAAQAILRDVRVAAAITMVTRLLEARDADPETMTAYRHLATQLGHISAPKRHHSCRAELWRGGRIRSQTANPGPCRYSEGRAANLRGKAAGHGRRS
jgi:hypothetical protein